MKKRILLITIIIVSSFCLHSQELIESITGVGGKNTIIREINPSNKMVYTESDTLRFVWLDDSSSAVNYMKLPSMVELVTDFEISNDTVWFCGLTKNNTWIVGYFSLASFPNSQIEWFGISGVSYLKDIETIWSNPTQLVLIAVSPHMPATPIIHAIRNTSGWEVYNFLLVTSDGDYCHHDDMTKTSNYIVLTSHKIDSRNESLYMGTTVDTTTRSYDNGLIWYIDYFSTWGGLLVTAPASSREVSYKVSQPFLIDKGASNEFATVTLGEYTDYSTTSNGIIVSKYSVGLDQGTTIMNYPVDSARLVDFRYSINNARALPLIRRTLPYGYWNYIVYVIDPTATWSTYVPGYECPTYYNIHSLILQSGTNFVMSGFDQYNPGNLPIFKFTLFQWGSCSSRIRDKTEDIENDKNMVSGSIQSTHGPEKVSTLDGARGNTCKSIICE